MSFSFTISTDDPALAARIAHFVAEFGAGVPANADAPKSNGLDEGVVCQIADALTYVPLWPTHETILRAWHGATDWLPINTLHELVIKEGLAESHEKAVTGVRGALAILSVRVGRKVGHRGAGKPFAALVEIRHDENGASYRITNNGREAVRRALGL